MIFRMINEQWLPQVKNLWAYSFEKESDPFFKWYFEEFCCKDNMVIGGFDEHDKLQNMLHLNPYMLKIRDFEQLTPYIVGVATAPAARGKHLFKPLLDTTFQILRSQGFPFVILMPIFAGIYLPYEFSYCYNRHKYSLPIDKIRLKNISVDLNVEYLPFNKDILAKIYYNITKSWNGVPVRTDFQWDKLKTVHELEGVQTVVCYKKDDAAGYMLYKIEDRKFVVLEMLADSQDVKNKFLHYAAMHKSEADIVEWLAEEWDKTYLGFDDQSLSGSVYPFMMARCIDARLALSKLGTIGAADGEINLLLTDSIIDENNHLLKIKVQSNRLTVESTIENEDIIMNMSAFTQMFFGIYTASELCECGYIKCDNMEKLFLLDSIFPKCRNYINEYF